MDFSSEKLILQIGPKGKGGVDTVIKSILNTDLSEKYRFHRIDTMVDDKKIIPYIKACIECKKLVPNTAIAHIHMASKGSYIRKSRLVEYYYKKGIPVILHLHGGKFREFYTHCSKRKKDNIRRTFQEASKIVVLANDWHYFVEVMGVEDKTEVISNFTKIPELVKKSNNSIPVFLFMGKIGKRKGSYDLVDAVAFIKINLGYSEFKCILAGDGEIDEISVYVKRKCVEDIITVVGWVAGKKREELFRTSDVLVLPSYFESFGLVLIEAMSYGVPVISTTAGSISQVVNDRKDGYLVEPGNIEQLAEKMKYFIDNPKERLIMGKNGRKHVIDSYSEEIFCKKISNVYDSLILGNCNME